MIKVVNIKGICVYPIFKNGKTAIDYYANEHNCKWFYNEQCNRVNPITVYLRRPKERFMSGVHTYIEFEKRKQNDVDIGKILKGIEKQEIINEHFMTQFAWLENLHVYYKGTIILKTVNDLRILISNREKPNIPAMDQARRQQILSINYNLDKDNIIFNNYIGAQLPLSRLLEKINHEVS